MGVTEGCMNIIVYISNISEDIWSFIESMPPGEQVQEINENSFLPDREIFTLCPHERNIVILPKALDRQFQAYYLELFQPKEFAVWVPAQHSGQTSSDLLHDRTLITKLVALGKKNQLVLKSYSCSAQFLELVAYLKAQGCAVQTPESPDYQEAWTVNFYGSKSGFRQLASQLSNGKKHLMAPGLVTHGIANASALAAHWHITHGGVVLKTNKAHAGVGVKIYKPDALPKDFSAAQTIIAKYLSQWSYWSTFPIVVEQYLDIDPTVGGGNPNCEYLVTDKGVEFLFTCGMRVTEEGMFKGIEVHRSILSKKITNQLTEIGEKLGQQYLQDGYRGYFDVDCVSTKNGELLLTESNVRRTGGTHVYHAVYELCGEDFMDDFFVVSNNIYKLPHPIASFKKLHHTLEPLLFSREKKEGVVIVSANLLKQDCFGYIIIGKNKKRTMAIETEMEKRLTEVT